jgi:hypothetical protein
MDFKEYITEAVDKQAMHDKLLKRYYNNVSKKKERAKELMYKADSEYDKIVDIMKRHGIDELLNHKGYPVVDVDKEFIWDFG